MTPLHFAAFKGRLDVVKLLLEAKASMTVEDTEGWERLGRLGGMRWAWSARGSSPLHNAAFYGHIDVVKMLVEAKAPVAATDINGLGPQIWVAEHGGCRKVLRQQGYFAFKVIRDAETPPRSEAHPPMIF